MGKLNADRRVLAAHEGDQRLEALRLRIVPDAEIVLVDQADFLDGRRLDKDKPKTAERIAAEMHGVKGVAGAAGAGAVVDHRRHHQAILDGQAAHRERLEQQGACSVDVVINRD